MEKRGGPWREKKGPMEKKEGGPGERKLTHGAKKEGGPWREKGGVGGPGMAPRTTFSMSSRELVYRGGALEREKGDPWKKEGGPGEKKEGGLEVQELPLARCFLQTRRIGI